MSFIKVYVKHTKLIPYIIVALILSFNLSVRAESTSVVKQFGENLSSWVSNQRITDLHAMENLCSKSPSFRIGNKLMASMADKNNLTKTLTYDWDNFITCLQKEVDNGLQISFSNIQPVPEGCIEMNYPGLQYVSCSVKINSSSSNGFKDLFILKNEKIVKITDYIEKIDEITGKKKIEIDYLELARAAFVDGDYQKCYDLYKNGGLKQVKSEEKRYHYYGEFIFFPYIESCIALKDWNGAMYGFTRIMNRKYWVNGIEWTLNPEDIRDWTKEKTPLMTRLLELTYRYYIYDVESIRKSPLIRHVQTRTGLSTDQYLQYASQYFMQNKNSYCDRVTALKAAADCGHTDAQRQIGKLYLTGYNLNKENLEHYETMLHCDTIKAVYWFDKASERGDIEASKIAASFHLGGIGIEKNEAKAYSCYSSCEAQLDYDVQFGLGICHYYGIGTYKNEDTALQYLIMAEDWHPETPYLIAQIYLNKSDSRAIKYLSKILQRKNVNDGIKHETLKILSDCYRLGKCGISINTEESDRLALEANKYVQMAPQQMQDYFISLTHIDFENEPL
ncbi:tetratricopeptide repeat protein [Leyella stercorea]